MITQIMCTASLFLSLKLQDMHASAQEFCAAHHSVMNKLHPQKNPAPLCPQTTHVIREELCIAESKLLKCVGFGVGIGVEGYRLLDDIVRRNNLIEKETKTIYTLGRVVLLEIFRSGCSMFFAQNSLAFAAYLIAFKLQTGFASPEHLRRSGAVYMGQRSFKEEKFQDIKRVAPECSPENPDSQTSIFGRGRWEKHLCDAKSQPKTTEISDSMLGKRVLQTPTLTVEQPCKLLDFTQTEPVDSAPANEGTAAPISLPNLPVTHPELQEPESANQPRILHALLVPANSPLDDPQSSAEQCAHDDCPQPAPAESDVMRQQLNPNTKEGCEITQIVAESATEPKRVSKLDKLRGMRSFLEDRITNKPAVHPATQCPELFPLGLRLDSQAPGDTKALAELAKTDGRSNQSTNATPQSVPTLDFIVCPSEPLVRIDSASPQTNSGSLVDDDECFKRFFEDFSPKHVNLVEIFEVMSITIESIKQKLLLRKNNKPNSTTQPSQNKLLLQGLCSRTAVSSNRPFAQEQPRSEPAARE